MAADEAKAKGNAAFSTGNFMEAISHFSEAINISPNNHIFYSNRSAAHASLANFTQALTDAQKTVEIKPDWPKSYSRLAASYMGLKNYPKAISSYQKGLELDPDNDFFKAGLANATNLSQRRLDLKKAFQSAKQSGEMLKLLKEMDSCFDESELGMEYWAIARELLSDSVSDGAYLKKQLVVAEAGGIQDKVLFYGKKALKVLLDDSKQEFYTELPCIKSKFSTISIVDIVNDNINHHDSSLFVASVYASLGAVCFDLRRLDESLSYLVRANEILTKLEGDNRCGGNCVISVLDLTMIELCKVKQMMGRFPESIAHMKKVVEIREMVMEDDCFELGQVYNDVCSLCMVVMDLKQARPFCLKALEIFTKHVGTETVDVAGLRRSLALIYTESNETKKAIEQNRLAVDILKKVSPYSPDLLALELENAHMMIELGRHEEVIDVLKGMVSRDDIGEKNRAMAYVTMAKASGRLGNFADAKKYMRTAERILVAKGLDTSYVAILFGDMSDQFMKMNDFETAISYSKKALSFPKFPERVLAECSSRIFSLVSLIGKEKEELSYMKDLVEKLKERFGTVHREVGFGYISLGAAYLKSGQSKSAVKFMEMAKDTLDATVGYIPTFCPVEDRNHLVINILGKVIKDCEGKQDVLDVAVEILKNLKG